MKGEGTDNDYNSVTRSREKRFSSLSPTGKRTAGPDQEITTIRA
jgi:hypothetical protein